VTLLLDTKSPDTGARLNGFFSCGAGEHPGDEPDDGGAVLPPRPPTGADPAARPLVVMTPKGLLRLKQASSTLATWPKAVPSRCWTTAHRTRSRYAARPLLRKDLLRPRGAELRDSAGHVAIARSSSSIRSGRAEGRARRLIPEAGRVVWAQEEPRTWGRGARSVTAWREPAGGRQLRYVGRPWVEPERGLSRRTLCANKTGLSRSIGLIGPSGGACAGTRPHVAIVGPCFRASLRMVLRCRGGMRARCPTRTGQDRPRPSAVSICDRLPPRAGSYRPRRRAKCFWEGLAEYRSRRVRCSFPGRTQGGPYP